MANALARALTSSLISRAARRSPFQLSNYLIERYLIESVPEMTDNIVTSKVDVLDGDDVLYKGGDFIRTPKALLYTFDLSNNAKALWMILEEHAGSNRQANPGQKRLAALMNVSVSTLKTYLQELREQGWIITDGATGDTLSYKLCIPSAYGSLDPEYQHSTAQVPVKPKTLKKAHCGLDSSAKDRAPKFAISANSFIPQGVAGNLARGVAEIPARGSQDSGQGVAENLATNNKNEPEEVTIRKEQPVQPPAAADTEEETHVLTRDESLDKHNDTDSLLGKPVDTAPVGLNEAYPARTARFLTVEDKPLSESVAKQRTNIHDGHRPQDRLSRYAALLNQ